jgi:hypothetical protein
MAISCAHLCGTGPSSLPARQDILIYRSSRPCARTPDLSYCLQAACRQLRGSFAQRRQSRTESLMTT